MNKFSPISERMEFECRWLLLFHQSATADRRGEHPFYWAGTTGHRIRTTAGNDCVIRPQEHTQPCTDALRQTHHWSSIHPVSSNTVSLRDMTSFIARVVYLFPMPHKSTGIHYSCFPKSTWKSDRLVFILIQPPPTENITIGLISSCYINIYIADMWGSECLKLVLLFKIPSVQH